MRYIIVTMEAQMTGQDGGTIYLVVDTKPASGLPVAVARTNSGFAGAIRDALNASVE